MHHAFKLGDDDHAVALSRAPQGYRLHRGDAVIDITLETAADGRCWLTHGKHRVEIVIAVHGDDIHVHLDGETHALRYRHPLERLAAQAVGSAEDQIVAPMPGSVVSVAVKSGDAVQRGQMLLVMESMKMETTLTAPRDGVIAEIGFETGQTFDRDAVLLRLESQS